MPSRNRAFWQEKLNGNTARDTKHLRELKRDGWRVAVVWE